jgi:hypothetical protein
MIQVTVGTNTDRKRIIDDGNTSIRKILEDNDVQYATATVHLDGIPLSNDKMDKTLGELGITEKCYLLAVVKVDNASRGL